MLKTEKVGFAANVMNALKEPSADHMPMYIFLMLSLAVLITGVAFAINTFSNANAKKSQVKVSLDDVFDETSKPKKGKVVEQGEGTFDKDALYKVID